MNNIVYLAGAIDALRPDNTLGPWRDDAAFRLNRAGFTTFNPHGAFKPSLGEAEPNEYSGTIQEVNYAAIRSSVGVLVEFRDPMTEYVGTLMEVGYATALGKPVVVWTKESRLDHLSLFHPGVIINTGSLMDAVHALIDAIDGDYDDRPVLEYAPNAKDDGLPNLDRAYPGDAGIDIPTERGIDIPAGTFVDVPLAFRLAPPPGYWFRLIGRSSTLRKFGLLVNEGIIDQGWRGQLFAGVYNLTGETVRVEKGQRIVQAVIERVHADELRLLRLHHRSALRPGDRGENGFGSTGYGVGEPAVTVDDKTGTDG